MATRMMSMKTASLTWASAFGSLLVAGSAAADTCPPPAPGETALYAAAAALAPGESCELMPSLGGAELEAVAGGRPVQWADSAAWDPVARRIHFIGRDAGCGSAERPFVHMQYDDATSSWSLEPIPPISPCGHAYDASAVDPTTGIYYFRAYSESTVWGLHGSTWSSTPSVEGPAGSSPAIGLIHFSGLRLPGWSESGALVWADRDQLLVLARGATKWRAIALPTPIGWYSNFAEHDPVHGVAIFGGGNDAGRTVVRLDADGSVTTLGAAPVELGVHGESGAFVSVDPVRGEFLVYSFGNGTDGWWTLDAVADVWTPLEGLPELSLYSFQVPITDYGVVAFFDEAPPSGGDPTLWIYRHRPSDLPPLRDGGPGAADGGPGTADGGPGQSDAAIGPRDGSLLRPDGEAAPGGDPGPGAGGCGCHAAGSGVESTPPWLAFTATLLVLAPALRRRRSTGLNARRGSARSDP